MPSVSIFKPTVVRAGKKTKGGVWWMAWRDQDGKQHRRSTEARDKAVAKQVAHDLERQLVLDPIGLHDHVAANHNKTFAELTEEIVKARAKKPGTATTFRYCLRAFAVTMPKVKLLREIKTATVEDFASERHKVVVAATVNKELRHLRAALRWAQRRHYLREVPQFKHAFVMEPKRKPVIIPEADYHKMLAAIPTAKITHRSAGWWRVFLTLAYHLGARRGELLGLTWDRVDLPNRTLRILYSTSKRPLDRDMPLLDEVVTELAAWRKAEKPKATDAVLPWLKPTKRQLYEDLKRICKTAGVPNWVPKNCRSTCGSRLVAAGINTVVGKDYLGHTSVATFEGYYANTDPALRAAAEALRTRAK